MSVTILRREVQGAEAASVEIQQLCAALRKRVIAKLHVTAEPAAREELLIAALYELSRTILPVLGVPRRSQTYQEQQEAVAELISVISIPLILNAVNTRSVAVLSEIAEGCPDPLLKKKFSVYAHELLVRSGRKRKGARRHALRNAAIAAALCCTALVGIYCALPSLDPPSTAPGDAPMREVVISAPAESIPATAVTPLPAQRYAGEAGLQEATGRTVRPSPGSASDDRPAASGELVTRVRFSGYHVLVPVTLKHGGELVRVELVLDTGATRTAIHEAVAARLGIELRSTEPSQAEVADGRVISSHSARIDSLGVGPFAMAPADVELIQYQGDGTHAGLLGMDFLARHRYQIDIEHELIRWF